MLTVITTASLSFAILVAATIPSRQTPRFLTSLTARTAAVEPYSRPRPNGRTCPEPVIRGAKGTIALLRALQPAGSNLKRHRPNAPPQQAARRTPCGTLGASSGTARTACIRAKCVRSSIGDGDRSGPHPLESFSLARRRAACSADGRKVPQKGRPWPPLNRVQWCPTSGRFSRSPRCREFGRANHCRYRQHESPHQHRAPRHNPRHRRTRPGRT